MSSRVINPDAEGIPFTQYLMPDGRQADVWVRRSPGVEDQARKVIASGLRFEAEMLSDYRTISLTVVDPLSDDGHPIDVDGEIIPNGPEVPLAVDRLVGRAFARLTSQEVEG